MLEELTIEGLGVIEHASARLHPGFTVLTGETGAGKTMIVTSLHLLSGARADAGRVRTGSPKAIIEGRFRLPSGAGEVAEMVSAAGGEVDDDDSVIAVRTVAADGRSRAHVGGRSVPVGVLGQITTSLLTIHGQNDQLRLLKPEHQRSALDTFAGAPAAKALTGYRSARDTWTGILDELEQRRGNMRELAQEADRLRFGIGEIDVVDPSPGEDTELTATIRRLTDLETIRTTAVSAHGIVADEGRSVIDGLGQVRSLLESSTDDTLRGLLPRVAEALTVVTDVGAELTDFLSDLPTDADSLDQLLTRQAELKALLRKYAPDIDGVIEWRDEARARLAEIEDPAGSIEELEAALADAAHEVAKAAGKLTAIRLKAADSMGKKVSRELAGLAMGEAAVAVAVTGDRASADDRLAVDCGGELLHAGPNGTDRVEFSLVAHRDALPLPIARWASGGELSRVMLALEVVLAEPTSGSIMVFDEVDAGVGGAAAVEIGRRLSRLARAHQVIVVTHLPQVAAFADNHLVIGKQVRSVGAGKAGRTGKVTSTVRTLDRSERVAELARMLAGLGDSDTGRAHAEELLATAEAERGPATEGGRERAG